jgi:hypothetical protein
MGDRPVHQLRKEPLKRFITSLAVFASITFFAGCGEDDSETTSTNSTSITEANTAEVVSAAQAFLDTLSAKQQEAVLYDIDDPALQAGWSNFPTGFAGRSGVPLADMDDAQAEAALAVMEAALSEQGYTKLEQIRIADDYLASVDEDAAAAGAAGGGDPPNDSGGPDNDAGGPEMAPGGGDVAGLSTTNTMFSSDAYFIAFFGEPAEDGQFTLQFGGHHLAHNITYDADSVSFAPTLTAVEPPQFEFEGTSYEPLAAQTEAVSAAIEALSEDEVASAEISGSFDDLLLGPQVDGPFPEPEGIVVADAPQEAQDAVTDAIQAWVGDLDEETAEALIEQYTSEYDETYLGYSATTDVNDTECYIRIDGPSVWIEFSCQAADEGVHYHTVYRDESNDYGGS